MRNPVFPAFLRLYSVDEAQRRQLSLSTLSPGASSSSALFARAHRRSLYALAITVYALVKCCIGNMAVTFGLRDAMCSVGPYEELGSVRLVAAR